MADFESTSVEMSEVAEPTDETGVEEQEFANPVSEESEPVETDDVAETNTGRTDADAAWARMRRENESMQSALEAARAELAEMQAEREARDEAFSRLTGRGEDAEIAALAEVTGMSEDEIRAEMEAARESAQKDLRIEQLEQQVNQITADRLMQADLEKLRRIDPSLGSLEDLGDDYIHFIAAGLPPEDAYWAIKAKQGANHREPAKPAGKVATGTVEKDYYTDAEIDAMSSDQLTKNYKKIMASWERNSK